LEQIVAVIFAHGFIQHVPPTELQFLPMTFELGVDDERLVTTIKHQVRQNVPLRAGVWRVPDDWANRFSFSTNT
jgi:hypothetical protein